MALYGMVVCYVAQGSVVWHDGLLFGMMVYCVVWWSIVWHGDLEFSMVVYCLAGGVVWHCDLFVVHCNLVIGASHLRSGLYMIPLDKL